jgi:hypothetical protein
MEEFQIFFDRRRVSVSPTGAGMSHTGTEGKSGLLEAKMQESCNKKRVPPTRLTTMPKQPCICATIVSGVVQVDGVNFQIMKERFRL